MDMAVVRLVCVAVLFGACSASTSEDASVVGVLLDYTGNAAANGFNLERGALLAEQLINAARPDDRPIRLVFRDSQGDLDQARYEAQALVEAGALAVIGPTGDEMVAAVAPTLAEAGVLLFSPIATTGNASSDAAPWFRMTPGNASGSSAATLYGENLAKVLELRGIKRVGVIVGAGLYNQELVEGFVRVHTTQGGEIAAQHLVDSDASRLSAIQHPSLRDVTVEGFLVALDLLPAANFIGEIAATTTPPLWFLTPRQKSDAFLLNTPASALQNALGISPRISFLDQVCSPQQPEQCFVERFSEAWGETPFEETYFMYDTAALLLIAVDRVLRQEQGQVPREVLAAELLKISATGGVQVGWNSFATAIKNNVAGSDMQYSGLTGPILFSPDGERRGGRTVTWTIHEGHFVSGSSSEN